MHSSHPDLVRSCAVKFESPERYDSNFGTEIGVLTVITGHGPTSPEGGSSHHPSGGDYLTICFTLRGSENPLTHPAAALSCTFIAPQKPAGARK
ncbi:hypothetical protein AVEN_197253-1 [Araneus ventricosus]|uniref:Uncharacterized protein n=1 Tax=Araneus ventricosus TaxID=182803 RepID=A0A4Y2LNN0_ARAVE|nr:hypothetical protein AVEN_197253-1 [Araneus ventricosus]